MSKKLLALVVASMLALALCACGSSGSTQSVSSTESAGQGSTAAESQGSEATESATSESASAESTASETEATKPKPKKIRIGETASSDQFTITLTDARVDSTLSSSESSTYWEPNEGACFVILEFDVTALTSDQLPVDDYAITDLVANYKKDTYASWTMTYIESQLWLYFRHTYLDANLPCHVYTYTSVPAAALESGDLSVDLTLAGTPYEVVIR